MSKLMLDQRQLPTLGLRSKQTKAYVGQSLSCYLGYNSTFSTIIYYHNKNTVNRIINEGNLNMYVHPGF